MNRNNTRKVVKLIFALLIICLSGVSAMAWQETVILSDDFSGADGTSLQNRLLNNALGGTATARWSNWDNAYTSGGVVEWHTGGTYLATGYELDPTKWWRLEVLLKPAPGFDSIFPEANNWAGLKMMAQDVNQTTWYGFCLRLTNNETVNNNTTPPTPAGIRNQISIDYWGPPGSDWNFRWCYPATIDPVNDYDENGWIPVRLEFTGLGTDAQPFISTLYLNGNLKYENLAFPPGLDGWPPVGYEGYLVGLAHWGGDPQVGASYHDDFKLTLLEPGEETAARNWFLYE
ncbi:hypothetical protein J7M23_09270 [Candidatus Sumerlaeota bacterium]|nr:hypothetical protein [Candidatus Sumerlaeota bacterium]